MRKKEKQTSKTDINDAEKTLSQAHDAANDANVDADGRCILTQDGEMARPDSGAPCDEGTGA